jgi:multidrug efflux pump subunit AcrA (membrane-fusion protein)
MTRTMKNIRRFAAAAALTAGLASSGCSRAEEAAQDEAPLPLTVSTARVAEGDLAETFEAGGVVQSRTTATVAARILAPVAEVRVVPGQQVQAGETLVVLDSRDLGAHERSARSALLASEQAAAAAAAEQLAADAALTMARSTHRRISDLAATKSATPHELDDVTAALRAADARAAGAGARTAQALAAVESARAASEAAAATASYAVVSAPFSGVITEKLAEPGNMASPGSPLLRLEDTRAFRLEVRVDESRVDRVRAGESVSVRIDSAGPAAGRVVQGTVSEIARAMDADARAFLVKIALPDSPGLRSGLFGRARFALPPRRALAVPPEAIRRTGQVTAVFVVDRGVARLRLVSLRGTEVLAGLADGELVIVNPPHGLTDGQRVSTEAR